MQNRLAILVIASATALGAGAASAQSGPTASAPTPAATSSETPPPGATPLSPQPAAEEAADSRIAFLSEPITVQAKRETAQARALNVIHGYSGKKHYWEAITGWDDSICVAVAGLEPAGNRAVKARVEAVARDAGLTVKPDRCGPGRVASNIEVLFTADPDRLLQTIARTRPWIVGGVSTRSNPLIAVRDFEAGLVMKRPIQAWYATACEPDVGWGGGWNEGLEAGICQKIMFLNVLVVVDQRRVPDLSRALPTDYVAMLALSQPASLDGCNALPSVIDQFSQACADHPRPRGLTETDTAYLKALYTGGVNLPPGYQAPGDIAGRMARILAPDKVATR